MMRSLAIFSFACLAGLAVQALFVHSISPYAVAPDFIVILALYLGLHVRRPAGVIGAFLLGVAGDFASAQFVGPTAAGAVVVYGIMAIVSSKIYAEHPLTLALLALLCSLADSLTYVAMVTLYVDVSLLTPSVLRGVALEALLTALCAPLVVRLLSWSSGESGGVQKYGSDRLRRVR